MLDVHHLAVVVQDLARSRQFYADVLGLEEIRRWDDDEGRLRSIWLRVGEERFLALERAESPGHQRSDEAPGWHCVALGIRRVERSSWRARFEKAGVVVERESAYTMYVRDPDQNLVGLSHYPDPVED